MAGRSRMLSRAKDAVTWAGPDDLKFAYHAYPRLDAIWFAEARPVANLFLRRSPSHPLSDGLRASKYTKNRAS
ncbi:MAG: hypothetical protein V2G44_05035 [bacterium JZ-2024 1]